MSELKNTARPAQKKQIAKTLTRNKHLSLLYFCWAAWLEIDRATFPWPFPWQSSLDLDGIKNGIKTVKRWAMQSHSLI